MSSDKITVSRRGKMLIVTLLICALASVYVQAGETHSPRERLLLDFGWKFHLGNEWGIAQNLAKAGTGSGPASTSFSDTSWRTINLPHDWAIELPFDQRADGAHGFKALGRGFESNSVAWYRRTFELPKMDAGKWLWLEFDGAFRDCAVFVNGWYVGRHESGYSNFRFDITDVVNCGGKNLVAVKVDATQFEGWFYEGAGIYRHTWLVKTAPVAIAPDGPAEIHVETDLLNAGSENAAVTVRHEIINPAGRRPAAVQLTPDRATINADGADISIVTVAIGDAQGRVVPTASELVQFDIEGPGKILGVGNGDPSSHEPDVFIAKWPVTSKLVGGWKWKAIADPWKPNLPEAAVDVDDSNWTKHDIESASGPLNAGDRAMFRTRFTVTAAELAAPTVELCFGMIDENGMVYVNGQKIGESNDWQVPATFDVKKLLRPGENVIAVAVANFTSAGGINKGVTLQTQAAPVQPQWQRSAFNGLAQIIVQSTGERGKIILSAKIDGNPARVSLEAR